MTPSKSDTTPKDTPVLLVRLNEDQWGQIVYSSRSRPRFSRTYPHSLVENIKPRSIVLLQASGMDGGLFAGYLKSKSSVSSFDSRVVVDGLTRLGGKSIDAVLSRVQNNRLKAAVARASSPDWTLYPLPPRLRSMVLAILSSDARDAAVLESLLRRLNRPSTYSNGRGTQMDALRVALKMFGREPEHARIKLTNRETMLPQFRLNEDAAIEHDARWINGWTLSDSDLTGEAVFTSGPEQLHIFTANKRKLEEVFGVDLIYLNERRGSIVMVQYKMMERHGSAQRNSTGWSARIDGQFADEIARMREVMKDLDPVGPYRLNPLPCYIKLINRDAGIKSPGIIIGLEHLMALREGGVALGPRGGERIGYDELDGHYLRGDCFVELVRSGYIGSRGATTDALETIVRSTLESGQAVVAAWQHRTIETPSLPPSAAAWVQSPHEEGDWYNDEDDYPSLDDEEDISGTDDGHVNDDDVVEDDDRYPPADDDDATRGI